MKLLPAPLNLLLASALASLLAAHASAQAGDPAPSDGYQRLPVEAFARLPDVKQTSLSRGGSRIASLVRINSGEKKGTAIQIVDLATGESIVPVYSDNEKFKLTWITWASDTQLLASAMYPTIRYGTQVMATRLISIDAKSGEHEPVLRKRYLDRLEMVPQFQDNIVDLLPDDDKHILLSLSTAPRMSEVMRVNIKNGKVKAVERNGYFIEDWLTDRQHRVRAAVKREETTYSILVRQPDAKDWETFWTFEAFSEDQVWPIGFDTDPNTLFVRKYHNDKLAIFRLDVTDPKRELTLVYSDDEYDVNGGLIYSSVANKTIGTSHSRQSGFTFWDPAYVALQDGINRALPDSDNIIVSFSDDERRYLLLATSDTDSGSYYLGDRDRGTVDLVNYRYRQLDPSNMAPKQWVSYTARDGVEIAAVLTVPKGSDGKSLPTVIFPHGGPISFDGGGFDYWTQFLANRGYAVLQMNFRGSSGYGFDFMSAGLQNWGQQMQDDVEDGTRWAIAQGIADPERICMVGASYGGYAALMEAANAPELYQCAVSFAGVTDVELLVRNYRDFTNYEVVKEQVGESYLKLKAVSPVSHASDVGVPVLLAHGTEDRVVRDDHSSRMYRALKRADKQVTYIRQDGGDHYLSNEEHRVQFFTELESFLSTYLDG